MYYGLCSIALYCVMGKGEGKENSKISMTSFFLKSKFEGEHTISGGVVCF